MPIGPKTPESEKNDHSFLENLINNHFLLITGITVGYFVAEVAGAVILGFFAYTIEIKKKEYEQKAKAPFIFAFNKANGLATNLKNRFNAFINWLLPAEEPEKVNASKVETPTEKAKPLSTLDPILKNTQTVSSKMPLTNQPNSAASLPANLKESSKVVDPQPSSFKRIICCKRRKKAKTSSTNSTTITPTSALTDEPQTPTSVAPKPKKSQAPINNQTTPDLLKTMTRAKPMRPWVTYLNRHPKSIYSFRKPRPFSLNSRRFIYSNLNLKPKIGAPCTKSIPKVLTNLEKQQSVADNQNVRLQTEETIRKEVLADRPSVLTFAHPQAQNHEPQTSAQQPPPPVQASNLPERQSSPLAANEKSEEEASERSYYGCSRGLNRFINLFSRWA